MLADEQRLIDDMAQRRWSIRVKQLEGVMREHGVPLPESNSHEEPSE